MLQDFEFPKYSEQNIQQIAQSFNVTIEFARTRFNMYKNKQFQYINHNQTSQSWIADEPSAFSNDQMIDSEILNDEFYNTFNLEVNATEKIQETIEFWHYIKGRKII